MTKQFARYMMLYTFVVFMILLRPYLAYQISMKSGLAGDMERTNRLLQRLVKKKEWHVVQKEEAMEIVRVADVEIVLPVILLLLLSRPLSWMLSSLLAISLWRNTVFKIAPADRYHLLLSRLQV